MKIYIQGNNCIISCTLKLFHFLHTCIAIFYTCIIYFTRTSYLCITLCKCIIPYCCIVSRLSGVLSSRLTDNNPNIANMSDEYRPTKLAEMYNELYDNEWTTAYTAMENVLGDFQLVSFLLDMLMVTYVFKVVAHILIFDSSYGS